MSIRVAAAALVLAGCAAPGADIDLAPAWSRLSDPDERSSVEALGGLWRSHSTEQGFEDITVGPLWSFDRRENGTWRSRFCVPLGYANKSGDGEQLSLLMPVYLWRKGTRADGTVESTLAALPGILVRRNEDHGTQVGWFPIIGHFDGFITFDELTFVLFPLWVRSRADERVTNSFLWPVFSRTRGGGMRRDRLWPFFGRVRFEDRFDRSFAVWPLLHRHRNHLGGGDEVPEDAWWFWPFYGRVERGTFTAHSVLWPFFGWSSDPETDFRAFDAPWFLVRFQHGGKDGVVRERVWPFYGHHRADGLETWTYAWPIVHVREERSTKMTRDSVYVVPLWQSWDRVELADGRTSSWRKLWPLFQRETDGRWSRASFPTLDPFWRNELIDRHYGWLWKLFEWEGEAEVRRERSWLGLWRRERDAREDRRHLAFLWSDRRYADGQGREVSETSLLFGLLRWRTIAGEGRSLLAPALPGPGWPALRGEDR